MHNAIMVDDWSHKKNIASALTSVMFEFCDQDAVFHVVMTRAPLVTVPERLVTHGFHIGESLDAAFPIEMWLRGSEKMSGAILIDDEEARTLAAIMRLATDGFVQKGSVPLKASGELVTIFPQHRGRVRIGLDSLGLSAQLKRSQVHRMADELRSAA